MRGFFDYVFIDLLPFWQQFFTLISAIAWPIALISVAKLFRPLLLHIFADRGISFEGFGAQIRIDERKASQVDNNSLPENTLPNRRLNLPRTQAIIEQETLLREAIQELPQSDVFDITVNALAIEQLEKGFALTYINIFGSQIVFLQKINERGGMISLEEGEEFFSEVKSKIPELDDWNFDKYINFLAQRNLLRQSKTTIELTSLGKDFIHFVVKYGLRTDKAL